MSSKMKEMYEGKDIILLAKELLRLLMEKRGLKYKTRERGENCGY